MLDPLYNSQIINKFYITAANVKRAVSVVCMFKSVINVPLLVS